MSHLKEDHIFSSRNTKFEYKIAQMTNGEGVDVVLNSLASELLFASVRSLRRYGTFLEIGKFDLFRNSALGMEIFLRSITFCGILIDEVLDSDPPMVRRVLAMIRRDFEKGIVKPIPHTLYKINEVEKAMRTMAQGKHMGKLVLEIRAEEDDKRALNYVPPLQRVSAVARVYPDPEQVYVITGGLGGLGLELTGWLVNRGARKVVLTSRSGLKSGRQRRAVAAWEHLGTTVVISNKNVVDYEQTKELIEECLKLGSVGGIFHLAMVLKDGLLEDLTQEMLQETTRIKLDGARNLDQLSRKLCPDIRWFVCFSSQTAARGNTGQSAYGFANSAMERICERRYAAGYPSLVVNYGAIGDVGVLVDTGFGNNNSVVSGVLPQRLPTILTSLDMFMAWGHWQGGSFVRAPTSLKKSGGGTTKDILDQVAHVLGVASVDDVDPDVLLVDMGLDSLMGMEIKQTVEREAGIVLSIKEIRTLTMRRLKSLLSGEISAESGQSDFSLHTLSTNKASQAKMKMQMRSLQLRELLMESKMEVVVPMNELSQGPKVYFIHPVEGFLHPIRQLGPELKMPAVCFQCIGDVPSNSIPDMAAYYYKKLNEETEEPVHLVGYSYGASIALEMAMMVQADGREVASLTLIDSSPAYLLSHRKFYRMLYPRPDGKKVSAPAFESEFIISMMIRGNQTIEDEDALRSDLEKMGSWEERMAEGFKRCPEPELEQHPEEAATLLTRLLHRYLAVDDYEGPTDKRKFRGDIQLIKSSAPIFQLPQDYDLAKYASGRVEVVVVESDHEGLVSTAAAHTAHYVRKHVTLNTPAPTSTQEPETITPSN